MHRSVFGSNNLYAVIIPIIITVALVLLLLFKSVIPSTDRVVINKVSNRESFSSMCIEDKVGIIEPIEARNLYFFTSVTGIQPHIVIFNDEEGYNGQSGRDASASLYFKLKVKDSTGILLACYVSDKEVYPSIVGGAGVQEQVEVIAPILKQGVSKSIKEYGLTGEALIESFHYVLNSVDVV